MLLGKAFGGENQRRDCVWLLNNSVRQAIPTGVFEISFNAPYCYLCVPDGMRLRRRPSEQAECQESTRINAVAVARGSTSENR